MTPLHAFVAWCTVLPLLKTLTSRVTILNVSFSSVVYWYLQSNARFTCDTTFTVRNLHRRGGGLPPLHPTGFISRRDGYRAHQFATEKIRRSCCAHTQHESFSGKCRRSRLAGRVFRTYSPKSDGNASNLYALS